MYLSLSTVLLVSPVLSSCDALIDYAIDCIDNDKPELRPAELPNPILNQAYNQSISVSIRNEPYDDSFTYLFEFSGNFPTGIQATSSGRIVSIFGTPTVLGEFQFNVTVRVEAGVGLASDTHGLCSTVDSEYYSWSIQPM